MGNPKDSQELLEKHIHKCDGSIHECDDLVCGNKTDHGHSKCQSNQKTNCLKLKEALGGSGVEENDGGGILPEDNSYPPLQIPQVAGSSVTIAVEDTARSGNHELVVGANWTNFTSDDHIYQSQLVGKCSHPSIQSETSATKHYLLVSHDFGNTVTANETFENPVIPPEDSTVLTLQGHVYPDLPSNGGDNHNNKYEQAPELFPLTNRVLGQTISPPKTFNNYSFYHFPQPEDPFVSLPNVVDAPTETDLSTEDTSSASLCSDAMEVNEGSCHHSSLLVSPAAECVDSLSEVIHMWPPWMVERLFTFTVLFANILSTYSREYCSTLLATGCISVLLLTISILIDCLYFLHFL